MISPALIFDGPCDSVKDSGLADTSAAPDASLAPESPSEAFFDEIDVWARRALTANGFGDY